MLGTVVECLRFDERGPTAARNLSSAARGQFLDTADRAYLTPALAARRSDELPSGFREHLEATAAKNARRHQTTVTVCGEIDTALRGDGVAYHFLKGITQFPWYCDAPAHRPQFDVDLYCPGDGIHQAQRTLAGLGFEQLGGGEGLATDHRAPLIRRTAWRWREDFYDQEMPLTIELHHTLWNEEHWGFSPGGTKAWGDRQTQRHVSGLTVPALDLWDGLAYSAWHVLRHLLNGDLRPYHAYELAHFLERSAGEEAFWQTWQERYPAGEDTSAAIAFRAAHAWFGCTLHPATAASIEALPSDIQRWFQLFGGSSLTRGGKDSLLLHLCLVPSNQRRWAVAARRILPLRMPPRLLYDNSPNPNLGTRLGQAAKYAGRVGVRTAHHLTALGSLAASAVRWSREAASSRSQTSR